MTAARIPRDVVVKGFSVIDGKAPGIWMKGIDITVENNTVRHPSGDDYDGLRFFGDDLKIVHNTIGDISRTAPTRTRTACSPSPRARSRALRTRAT